MRGTPEDMPDASVNLAPQAPESEPAANPEPGSTSWHGVSRSPRSPGSPRSPRSPGLRPQRPGRRWLRWLRFVLLVILLPVVALGIGLLVAWIVHQIRGNPSITTPPAPSPSASPSASKSAPPPSPAPPKVVVPADWVTEAQPPAGLTFRHPPGWIRRTESPEILRFAPASAGSTAPGIEGVGAGLEPTTSPSQALQEFVSRAYGTQPQVQNGPITAVSGAHAGEQQEVVTYVRGGVPVRVVVHSFAAGDRSVIVLARAASAQPTRAAELEAFVEASLQITG